MPTPVSTTATSTSAPSVVTDTDTVDPDSLTAQQEGEDFMKFMSQMTGGG